MYKRHSLPEAGLLVSIHQWLLMAIDGLVTAQQMRSEAVFEAARNESVLVFVF